MRLDMLVLDRSGNIAAIEPVDSRGPLARAAPTETSSEMCRLLRGKFDVNSCMYARPDADAVAVGRVVFASVQVDFVDGTSRTMTTPPTIIASAVPIAASAAEPRN